MRKKLWYAVIFFQIVLIISLVKGLEQGVKSRRRIESLEAEKKQLEDEQSRLKEQGEYVASEYYLEKVARDELHLTKPGETIVIVPEQILLDLEGRDNNQGEEEKEIWQKWMEILTGKGN